VKHARSRRTLIVITGLSVATVLIPTGAAQAGAHPFHLGRRGSVKKSGNAGEGAAVTVPRVEVGDPNQPGAVGSAQWYAAKVRQGYHRVDLTQTPRPVDWFRREMENPQVPVGAWATVLVVGKPKHWEAADPRIESRRYQVYKSFSSDEQRSVILVEDVVMNQSVPVDHFPPWDGSAVVDVTGMLYQAWTPPLAAGADAR